MGYELSAGSFFIGLVILLVGVAFVRWHQRVADSFGSGMGSYERYKTYAIVTCVVGFLVMINLHAVILGAIVDSVFNR